MIYLNGRFIPIDEAFIPVLDRGFIFGDGVYEVIPVYSRRPFRLCEHLQRLQASLDGIRLANPHSDGAWKYILRQLIALNKPDDQSLYLQVTRGVAKRDHAFPEKIVQTVFIMSNPLIPPGNAQLREGVGAITAIDNRWLRCDIKSTALLPNVLLRQLAVDAGCTETLLLRDGLLTEGSASNVFVVKDNEVIAPPKSRLMLTGITYDVVLELLHKNEIKHELRDISGEELKHSDEIWITSSSKEILPVTTLDGAPVGNGAPGPIFKHMHLLYQTYKAQVMRAQAE